MRAQNVAQKCRQSCGLTPRHADHIPQRAHTLVNRPLRHAGISQRTALARAFEGIGKGNRAGCTALSPRDAPLAWGARRVFLEPLRWRMIVCAQWGSEIEKLGKGGKIKAQVAGRNLMAVAPEQTIKDVVTDFLASGPSVDDLIAYRLPEALQERAQYLLDQKRAEGLTATEQQEMDEFLQIDHLMALVKAKARLKRRGRA